MKVWDAKFRVFDALRAMDWRRYLCAMWVLSAQLRILYNEQMSDLDAPLAEATLDVVREVVAAGSAAGKEARAAELASRWDTVITEGERVASGGLMNTWTTFEGLATEIAGSANRFYAADWVMGAATNRWRDPGQRRVGRSEEVSDDSPMARTLIDFERVVAIVAEVSEERLDPVALKEQILGTEAA